MKGQHHRVHQCVMGLGGQLLFPTWRVDRAGVEMAYVGLLMQHQVGLRLIEEVIGLNGRWPRFDFTLQRQSQLHPFFKS